MQVGSLVICVDDKNQMEDDMVIHINGKLVRDEIYTVSALPDIYIVPAVELLEKPILWKSDGKHHAHKQSRFREIQSPMDLTEIIQAQHENNHKVKQPETCRV